MLRTDLTAIPGIEALTTQAVVAEESRDFTKFATAAALSSWAALGPHNDVTGDKVIRSWAALGPHNDVTGDKVIRRGTRQVKNRLAIALRRNRYTATNPI